MAQVFSGSLAIAAIIHLVAAYYNVVPAVLTAVVKGPKQGWCPRKVGPVSVSAAGRLSVGRPHVPLWLIDYWIREFHHHADTQAKQGKQKILSYSSTGTALYHKSRVLTPILTPISDPYFEQQKPHTRRYEALCLCDSFIDDSFTLSSSSDSQ